MNFSAVHFDTQKGKRHTLVCPSQVLKNNIEDFSISSFISSSSFFISGSTSCSEPKLASSESFLCSLTKESWPNIKCISSSSINATEYSSTPLENTNSHFSFSDLKANSTNVSSSGINLSNYNKFAYTNDSKITCFEKHIATPKRCASYSFTLEKTEFLFPQSDNVVQESDNVVQESDNVVQESDNVVQESDNVVQKSDNAVQKSDNAVQKSDNVVQESENIHANASSPLATQSPTSSLFKITCPKDLLDVEIIEDFQGNDTEDETQAEVLKEKLPLLVESMESLAKNFESSFEFTLNKNFKQKSYGIICIDIADSFQKNFLAQLADFLVKKSNLIFCGIESTKNASSCFKHNSSMNLLLEEHHDADDSQVLSCSEIIAKNNTYSYECNKDCKVDHEQNVISVFVKNVHLDKKTNEVTIKYFDIDETVTESVQPHGLWMTTKQLHYLLSMSLKYEEHIKKRLLEFWESSDNINLLALSKIECNDETSDVLEETTKKRKIGEDEQQKVKYSDIKNLYKAEDEPFNKKQAIFDHHGNFETTIESVDHVKYSGVSLNAETSNKYFPEKVITPESNHVHFTNKKSCKIVTLADIKNLSKLSQTSSPILFSLSNSQQPESLKNFLKTETSQSKTLERKTPATKKRKKAKEKAEEIVGLKVLRKLHRKLLNSLEAATAETHMLLELANDLTQGKRQ